MKLTMRERLANGVKHQTMLKNSFKGLSKSGRFAAEALEAREGARKFRDGGMR